MIKVTRLGGKPFYLNSDLIESLESTPDTTLVLTNGKRVIITESPEAVIARIVQFRQRISHPEPAPPPGES